MEVQRTELLGGSVCQYFPFSQSSIKMTKKDLLVCIHKYNGQRKEEKTANTQKLKSWVEGREMYLAHPRKLDPGPAAGEPSSDFTDARQLGCCEGPGSQSASKAAEQKFGTLGPCPLCLARALPFLCCRTDWWSWMESTG